MIIYPPGRPPRVVAAITDEYVRHDQIPRLGPAAFIVPPSEAEKPSICSPGLLRQFVSMNAVCQAGRGCWEAGKRSPSPSRRGRARMAEKRLLARIYASVVRSGSSGRKGGTRSSSPLSLRVQLGLKPPTRHRRRAPHGRQCGQSAVARHSSRGRAGYGSVGPSRSPAR